MYWIIIQSPFLGRNSQLAVQEEALIGESVIQYILVDCEDETDQFKLDQIGLSRLRWESSTKMA